MHTPFIDTRCHHALRLACNVSTYPHKFCLSESNRKLISSLTDECPGVQTLVEQLCQIQALLAPKLPLTGTSALWKSREAHLQQTQIHTTVDTGPLPDGTLTDIARLLDLQLFETVLSTMPCEAKGAPSSHDTVSLACQCVWLSELLALVILGIAKATLDETGRCSITPSSDAMRMHLRRVWFGSALEQASLASASLAIQSLAIVAADPARRNQLPNASVSALTIFPQHWRLPPDYGPVAGLLFDQLEPLLLMIIHAVHGAQHPGTPPFDHRHAAQKGITPVYELVCQIQAQLPVVDRLFDFSGGGLILGTRNLASGAIETAEKLAEIKLGANWHGKATSDAQKAYLLNRLKRCAHIEVLDFELLQHHTKDSAVEVDVDFFIRDNLHGQVYGVQLKHLKKRSHSGLLGWLSLLREPASGLGNLVRQLENLVLVARNDEKARAVLIGNGLTPAECERIIPVGLHNVGSMDMWSLQNGILLYDMHTFVNLVAGRAAVEIGMVDGQIIHRPAAAREGPPPSPHAPDSAIDAYLADPLFQHLSRFDSAARVSRRVCIGAHTVVAHGLGI
ncbi:hypothetical protein [Pseudomonas libanensis]|uniref:Uncharacterized protein n=1 Tax=Pseudomonas libanensis TaxID=75588 RepID=A0ABR5MBN4_9PSED|nr:hypothetical protein [Pseudomonas libanensis]KPG76687.1 hypothetical protein AEQ48_05480 [Pseudomonas libanensis]